MWLVLLCGVGGEGEGPEAVVVCPGGVSEGDASDLCQLVLLDV
jgi:hypothetical protein